MTQTAFPQLRITDYERSKAFYIRGLGFQVAWEHRFAPHLPVFTQITREGVSLFLSQHAGDCQVGGAAYIYVPDVDACYRDFVSRGVRPESAPSDASYGVREMCVVDPDGNRLRFGTPLPGGDAAPGGAPPSILWRRLDTPGHESARLSSRRSGWHLVGTAVFAHDRQPCRLDYMVVCDSTWQTISGRVAGWVGSARVEIDVSVDPARHWRLNGTECSAVAGCSDLDLHFSPSTNLLPIRRLALAVGQEAAVRAAWLRFPSFTLAPLEQVYRRADYGTYRYESVGGDGRFTTALHVNAAGFVTDYPGFWQAEAAD